MMVACCPRRVWLLGRRDRCLGGGFSVRMLPVRRKSFALLLTHTQENRDLQQRSSEHGEHTYTHTLSDA